jgi:hypothetical protein
MGDVSAYAEHAVVSAPANAAVLVRDGRGTEAVRVLAETNRGNRHPEIEE